jgi:succinate dehydrogenase flavin-adding protein (antitoxin of CptAB toxin-antitoxin module)
MENQELREILIKELGLEGLPAEAQDEVVVKLGEIILKSVTIAIYEKLSPDARAEFDKITEENDPSLIQRFLDEHVPDMQGLMEAEIKRTLQDFNKGN